VRNTIIFILLIFSIINFSFAKDRTEKEIKLGVFLEDLKQIGEYEPIEYSPEGLFPDKLKSFYAKSQYAGQQIGNIFVNQKGLNDKYPQRMMLGMAYFEYFYMQQVREAKYTLERFETKYPATSTKPRISKLYSLSEARKTMREALGLSINDDPKNAIETFYTMFKLYEQAELKEESITNQDKKIADYHLKVNQAVSKGKSLAKKKIEQRITEKEYLKEFNKTKKDLKDSISKLEDVKEYQLFESYIDEVLKLKDDPSLLLSGFKIGDFILKDLKKEKIKNPYNHDLTNAKFDNFAQEQLEILGNITKNNKAKKNTYSNEIQLEILNLQNGGVPVNRLLDSYRDDLNVKFESLNLQLASAQAMGEWALNDWANAWKSPIPNKVKDSTGIEVNLSEKDMESIKAQLAIQNFKEIVKLDDFKDLMNNNSEFANLSNDINASTKDFSFSFTLDDYARGFGIINGFDISNYADLTALANSIYGTNVTVEEYASAYQGKLDVINAVLSGNISAFDAGALAKEIGMSLQEVSNDIAIASSAGISVDLEAVSQGAGYDSFASAVDAYNAQYGTSYTVEEAREALGQ
jgi:hypothetical protein